LKWLLYYAGFILMINVTLCSGKQKCKEKSQTLGHFWNQEEASPPRVHCTTMWETESNVAVVAVIASLTGFPQ
jgi:hypothetical protein